MVDFPRCRRTTWSEADGWAESIARQVIAADRTPQTLVALTRGGWVPARLLADRLGLRRIVALRAQHWGVTATPSGRAELTEHLSAPVRGESVLVVDDITDTGESLEIATAHVRQHGATRVESAACLHIAHSKFRPEYFAEEIPRDQWVWVVFPWNFWEDLATLARRAQEVDPDPDRIVRTLADRCGLSVDRREVERALSILPPR